MTGPQHQQNLEGAKTYICFWQKHYLNYFVCVRNKCHWDRMQIIPLIWPIEKTTQKKKGPFIYQEFNSTCTMQIISVHIQNTVHILYPSQDTYLSFCANKNRVNIQLIGGLGWWLLLKAGWWPGDSLPRSVAHLRTHNPCPLHRCNSCQKKS